MMMLRILISILFKLNLGLSNSNTLVYNSPDSPYSRIREFNK